MDGMFEEYISGVLASVKYADFLAKGQGSGVVITEGVDTISIGCSQGVTHDAHEHY